MSTVNSYRPYDWFNALPVEVKREIAARQQEKPIAAGNYLYMQGDKLKGLFQIVRGHVEICHYSKSGDQYTLGVLKPGDWCGELSVSLDQPAAYSSVAREDSVVNMIALPAFKRLTEQYSIITQQLLIKTSKTLRMTMDRLTVASRASVQDRLMWLLRWSQDSVGVPMGKNSYCLEGVGLVDLQRMMGVARQTLSREFNALAKQGFIKLEQGNIVIVDAEALRRHSQESDDYFVAGS